jgi:hypothetical protein
VDHQIRLGIVLACFWALPAPAQIIHNPIGGPSTNTPGNTPPGLNGNTGNLPPDFQRPVYISGKVVLDDGTPPPDAVVMQLLCNGSPRNIGYTNLKGQFNLDLTDRNNSSRLNDASQGGASQGGAGQNTASWDGSGIGNNTQNPNGSPSTLGQNRIGSANGFLGCELLAELPGFRSDHVDLYNRHSLDSPEIGTLVLHRLANVQGFTISATTALAPKDAKKAFEKGRNAEKKEKWDEAETEFQKAVDQYPKFASAWFELGFAEQKRNNLDAARKSYARSIEADSKFINPYGQLAALAMREEKWDEVADTTSHLLQLNPVDFPMDWYYNAVANLQLQKLDVAEKSAREGLGADPSHHVPQLNYVLGIILSQKHDYPGAMDNLRAYLLLSPKAANADTVRKQLADVQKLVGPSPEKP